MGTFSHRLPADLVVTNPEHRRHAEEIRIVQVRPDADEGPLGHEARAQEVEDAPALSAAGFSQNPGVGTTSTTESSYARSTSAVANASAAPLSN